MSLLVWVMMGIAIWHFAVFVPDRFWGGIVGAFLAGLVLTPLLGIGTIRVEPGPAGRPLKVTLTTFPAKRHSTNSARAGVQPSSRASSNEHFSNRVPSGVT